jgi:hypothetical protein
LVHPRVQRRFTVPRAQKNALTFALLLAIVLLLAWRFGPPPRVAPNPLPSPTAVAANPKPKTQNPEPALPPAAAAMPPAEVSHLADTLNSPATDIRSDLRVVAEIIGAFRSNFPQAGNPVGNNAEITAVLTGKNQLRLALIPPNHPAINAAGELCDRWGTPFFFHAETGTKMEIRSAGPDKKFHTADDAVLSP